MKTDDNLCLCFHVSWRKVINFIRVHRIKIPSQLSECQGAGTGCGWCRSAMKKLVQRLQENPPDPSQIDHWLAHEFPSRKDYQAGRATYIEEGRGIPPARSPDSST